MVNWAQLVEERNVWVAHNFPDPDGRRTPLDSILGCIEELGELTHSHLKEIQHIRGTAQEHQENARDAIGDLTVYLLGVMNAIGLPNCWHPYSSLQYADNPDDCLLRLATSVGNLTRPYGPTTRGIGRVVYYLEHYCRLRGWNYGDIVRSTWHHVKQRDWIKYPTSGLLETEPVTLDFVKNETRMPDGTVIPGK